MSDPCSISISTGAYAEFPLAAALVRIAELAPAAEICSWGRHSLLEPGNARAVQTIGLSFSVHGPLTHTGLGSRSETERRAAVEVHRRHLWVAAELGATRYVVHPDLRERKQVRDAKVVRALERSFAELGELQEELGLRILVENMAFNGRSHFVAPNDLDLQGLGVALDVGHAAISGTLTAWLAEAGAGGSEARPQVNGEKLSEAHPQAHGDDLGEAPSHAHRDGSGEVHLRSDSDSLGELHLHDNRGYASPDAHDRLGTGVVDAVAAVGRARAAGVVVVLEHIREDDVLASIAYLRRRGLISRDGCGGG